MTREERRVIRARQFAYIAAGLTAEKIQELTWEYVTALAAGDNATASKYATELAEAHTVRQAIKRENPRPE